MLTLQKVKAQCRIDPDFNDEDALLKGYIGASQRFVENFTRRKLAKELSDKESPNFCEGGVLLFDEAIETAMLLLVAHWNANREASVIGESATEIPLAVEALLQPYKVYGV